MQNLRTKHFGFVATKLASISYRKRPHYTFVRRRLDLPENRGVSIGSTPNRLVRPKTSVKIFGFKLTALTVSDVWYRNPAE
mmetsp:Transcript_33645/g.81552  ORF Transcript_33645/g.81552 Transcript_33645/m.81552 type:complete len:81 (-) Transcript_33645:1115-1357(-)